jgi:signal transduction histidine kinase
VTIESGIELDGDPPEVELLLDNLIENALKFSAGQSQPRVQLTATQEQGRTLVHVSDNGAGFAPGDAVRIFQLFTHRCAPEFEGTGVGLAIAKRVVERHGGLIWAEGVPGQGATFSFYL